MIMDIAMVCYFFGLVVEYIFVGFLRRGCSGGGGVTGEP